MNAALGAACVTAADVAAAGAVTPGVLREDGTVAVSVLPGWTGLALSERLTDLLGFPTRAEDDANLAVLAERWHQDFIGNLPAIARPDAQTVADAAGGDDAARAVALGAVRLALDAVDAALRGP